MVTKAVPDKPQVWLQSHHSWRPFPKDALHSATPFWRVRESDRQTGAAPCQLNEVPEKGITNINIGLISPEALKSPQSLLALAILQELVDLTSTLCLSAHHTLQPPPLLSSLQPPLSLQSGCFQLSQSFLNWPDKAVDKNQITNCCFFIYIYIYILNQREKWVVWVNNCDSAAHSSLT